MSERRAKIGGLDSAALCIIAAPMKSATLRGFPTPTSSYAGWGQIKCAAGSTKIARVLKHIRAENEREKVAAAVFVGDAVEEPPDELYLAAAGLGVPVFWFQEGDDLVIFLGDHVGNSPWRCAPSSVEQVFRELARLTGGAYGKFNAGAAKQLAELLRAVAAFAVGGLTALADQRTESARKLLGQ